MGNLHSFWNSNRSSGLHLEQYNEALLLMKLLASAKQAGSRSWAEWPVQAAGQAQQQLQAGWQERLESPSRAGLLQPKPTAVGRMPPQAARGSLQWQTGPTMWLTQGSGLHPLPDLLRASSLLLLHSRLQGRTPSPQAPPWAMGSHSSARCLLAPATTHKLQLQSRLEPLLLGNRVALT